MKIIFFGSTLDSVIVASELSKSSIVACVTQPPKPVGREKIITPTPVELWAEKNNIAVLSFPANPEKSWMYANEQTVIDTLEPFKADVIISASYGQKIPAQLIKMARYGGLNIHPSILPRWRGADPVPWAILSADHQIGVTIVTLAEKFDQGKIIAQKKIPITDTDTSDPLRTKLFELGAQLLKDSLPDYLSGKIKGNQQSTTHNQQSTPYARKFTRDDGFIDWATLEKAQTDTTGADIERKFRALTPWPGVWTKVANLQSNKLTKTILDEKRLKILKLHLDNGALIIDLVQLEGKKPVPYAQFVRAYRISS